MTRIDPGRWKPPVKTEESTDLVPVAPARTPLLRKTRLKPVSAKRQKLMRIVGPARKAFVAAVGKCMVCREADATDPHEIASGYAREKCLSHLELQIACCRECHKLMQHSPPAEQIAVLVMWGLDRLSTIYNDLMGRNLVEADDVIARLIFRNLKNPKK